MFGNQSIYGNPYPMRYQQPAAPVQPYYQPTVPIPQQQTQDGLIRVTGVDGAKAYPVAPNSVVPLFDADRDVFYIKSADAGGFPTIRAFTFAQMQEAAPTPATEYITRAEFEEWKEAMNNGQQPVRKAAKPAADAE